MLRALFIEYPDDPTAWTIDDQYMFGSDLLVAPLLSDTDSRKVYLPEGSWIDYQTGKTYSQGWHTIAHGDVPIVVLVKDGSAIPHIELAQSTKFMDWTRLEMVTFSNNKSESRGKVFLPGAEEGQEIVITHQGEGMSLSKNPLGSTVDIAVTSYQQFD